MHNIELKPESVKIVKEYIGERILKLVRGKMLFGISPKVQATKAKPENGVQLKHCHSAEETAQGGGPVR